MGKFRATIHRGGVARYEFETDTLDETVFSEYKKIVKLMGLGHRREPEPRPKNPNMTPSERRWIGQLVSFNNNSRGHIRYLKFGCVNDYSRPRLTGVVWALAPRPNHYWVYVEGFDIFDKHISELTII